MRIPSVIKGLIKTEDGKVFELDSSKGSAWLESHGSFRFEPSSDSKPYTVRKESGIYWYGCRKVAGKVRKKYIGKSLEVSVAKLEEIAEALEIPPVPRANKVAEVAEVAQVAQVTEVVERVAEVAQVTEVAEKVTEAAEVAEKVTEVAEVAEKVTKVAQDRLTALELQVANLQKTVEALQEELLGKLELGDSSELPKVDNEVVERLHNELCNLKAENEKLRADYAALLESSTVVADNLRKGVRELQARLEVERADREEVDRQLAELRSQLEAEKTRWDELREELDDAETTCGELRSELESAKLQSATSGHLYQEIENLKERNRLLQIKSREERQKLEDELAALKYRDESQSRRLQEKQAQIDELSDLKQNSESDFDSAGKAGELVSWLRKEVGKALPKSVTVKAIQKILEE